MGKYVYFLACFTCIHKYVYFSVPIQSCLGHLTQFKQYVNGLNARQRVTNYLPFSA